VFGELTVGALLDELAAPQEAPGGSSALALVLAAAAALVTMAARLSADSWEDARGLAAQAQALQARAFDLMDTGAQVYRRALAARAEAAPLPQERRDFEVGRAFAAAAEPPLELGSAAADVAELAAVVAAGGAEAVRADALVAAALAAAVARGARALVAVNLTALPGDPRIEEAQRFADLAERAASIALR
jgi:formiminotetrahydrofolate cyclodeaminase